MSLRPRQYAAQILALKTRAERQAALDQVPPEWRELVKKHGEIAWLHPQRKTSGDQPDGQETT